MSALGEYLVGTVPLAGEHLSVFAFCHAAGAGECRATMARWRPFGEAVSGASFVVSPSMVGEVAFCGTVIGPSDIKAFVSGVSALQLTEVAGVSSCMSSSPILGGLVLSGAVIGTSDIKALLRGVCACHFAQVFGVSDISSASIPAHLAFRGPMIGTSDIQALLNGIAAFHLAEVTGVCSVASDTFFAMTEHGGGRIRITTKPGGSDACMTLRGVAAFDRSHVVGGGGSVPLPAPSGEVVFGGAVIGDDGEAQSI